MLTAVGSKEKAKYQPGQDTPMGVTGMYSTFPTATLQEAARDLRDTSD